MNDHDLTTAILNKVDECPKCGHKMEQASRYLVKCQTCGFRIRTGDTHYDNLVSLLIVTVMIGGLGLIALFEYLRLLFLK